MKIEGKKEHIAHYLTNLSDILGWDNVSIVSDGDDYYPENGEGIELGLVSSLVPIADLSRLFSDALKHHDVSSVYGTAIKARLKKISNTDLTEWEETIRSLPNVPKFLLETFGKGKTPLVITRLRHKITFTYLITDARAVSYLGNGDGEGRVRTMSVTDSKTTGIKDAVLKICKEGNHAILTKGINLEVDVIRKDSMLTSSGTSTVSHDIVVKVI